MNDRPDKRHPNSPLQEVVFEIRFPGETAVECRRHEFQQVVRDTYPVLRVPDAAEGVPPALQLYRFEKEDGSAGLMVALNSFAYFCRRYPGFDAFEPECLKSVEVFASLFSLDRLTRIGLRHINIIPFARNDGLLPVEDFFVLGDYFSKSLGGFERFSLAFVLPAGTGKITTKIESLIHTDETQEAFVLDFDYAQEGRFRLSDIKAHLSTAHTESAALFHKLVTITYRDYIKGTEVGG